MRKTKTILRILIVTFALSLMTLSAGFLSNPVTAYSWTCCVIQCHGNGPGGQCSYSIKCCGFSCTGGDGVGCQSYDEFGEVIKCVECATNACAGVSCD